MPRPSSTLTVLFALASGCATGMPRAELDCGRSEFARCDGPHGGARDAAIQVGSLAAMTTGYFLASPAAWPARRTPTAPAPKLVGQIRRAAPSQGTRPLLVTLRGDAVSVVQTTTTDRDGQFRFALPRKPAWYTVAVASEDEEGETTVWVQHRAPDTLEVIVRPRSSPVRVTSPRFGTFARGPGSSRHARADGE